MSAEENQVIGIIQLKVHNHLDVLEVEKLHKPEDVTLQWWSGR